MTPITLADGNYVIIVKADVTENGADSSANISCDLKVGASTVDSLTMTIDNNGTETLSMVAARTVSGGPLDVNVTA